MTRRKRTLAKKKLSVSAAETSSSESKVKIKGIKKVKDVKAVIDKASENQIKTDIIAINESSLEFESAEITLAKHGNVNVIMRCENFDFENSICENWEITDIPFIDDGDVGEELLVGGG